MANAYKRILLKLSGEALQGKEGFGIDPTILDRMASEIKEIVTLGVQVGLVIGGGNIYRGASLAKAGMNRVIGDHMGMLATVMNGLAMRDALFRADVDARLFSAIPLQGMCHPYSWIDARERLFCSLPVRVILFSPQILQPVCAVLKSMQMPYSKVPRLTACTRQIL